MKFRYGQNKQADEIVERMIRNNVLTCQSSLVDMLIMHGFDGFSMEEATGIYIDPTNWAIESVYEFADDNGIELDEDPRKMTLEELCDIVDPDADSTVESLREEIESIREDDWKDQIREWSEENPAEPLEWWLVDSWLAGQLQEMTQEPVLDNDFGYWWGRTCSGQSIACDPTFYLLAESLGYFDEIDA